METFLGVRVGEDIMNNTIEFKNAIIQYWYNESPIMQPVETNINCDKILTTCKDAMISAKIALEIYLFKDAHYYGLLGIEYIPHRESKFLMLKTPYTNANYVHYHSSITENNRDFYCGMPDYISNSVRKHGYDYIVANNNIPSGKLIFNPSANSEVGSSPKIARGLTEFILQFLVRSNGQNGNVNYLDDIIKNIYLDSNVFY